MHRKQANNLDPKRNTMNALLNRLHQQQGGQGGSQNDETTGYIPAPRSPPTTAVEPVSKTKTRALRLEQQQRIPAELLDTLIQEWGGPDAATIFGTDGLLQAMTGALAKRVLDVELTHYLGYEKGATPPENQENRRNGTTPKTLRTSRGDVDVAIPRERDGTFEPVLVPKHQRNFHGFADQIVSLYGRGFSVRDIQAHVEDIYGTSVSPDLISRVTNAIVEEMQAWQTRPLEAVYAIVYLDALMVKIRDTGVVQNKAVYLAVGVTPDGTKDVLGMWVQATEGASFWLNILTELKHRGVQDILILCADGLTGLPDAVEAAFPRTIFQTCIVHLIRSSMRYVPWQDRKKLCAKLRFAYTAANEQAARRALDEFEAEYGQRYPQIAPAWRARWEEITPFLAFPAEIRRAIYTTNAIEALNRHIRKVVKTKGHFPTEEAALKLLYLNIQNARKWSRAPPYWKQAQQAFAIYFKDRFPQGVN